MTWDKGSHLLSLPLVLKIVVFFNLIFLSASFSFNIFSPSIPDKEALEDEELLKMNESVINNFEILKSLYRFEPPDEDSVKSRAECVYDAADSLFHQFSTIQLIEKEGYSSEAHYVTSSDGYIVEIHRIPKPGAPVVYLMPGIFQSSRDYLINCHGRALGFKLFKSGFDVWLGNYRGSTYGRNHTRLDSNSKMFWEFSASKWYNACPIRLRIAKGDELVSYDAAAAVDYILEKTNQEKLNWVGFSLGTTMLFGLLSARPDYNKKINVGITMAPAVYFRRTKAPLIKFVARNQRYVESFLNTFFNGEVLPPRFSSFMSSYAPSLCAREATGSTSGICSLLLQIMDGKDHFQLNYARLPLIAAGFPSSTSARVVCQWFQWINQPKFTKYNFGEEENLVRYGTVDPPVYNISNVVAPIVILWAENDYIVTKPDVLRLIKILPNVEATIRVNWKHWNHIDYLYGKDADILVYDYIISILKYKNPEVMENMDDSPECKIIGDCN